jgi:UDP-N-acetylmuramate--alanine ligase
VDVIDDYAHHPDEITAVLHAAREHYAGKRIVAVHQPHTYSRTWSLMDEFAASLDLADDVVLMEIYGVGEVNEHDISAANLGAKMKVDPTIVTTPEEAADAVRAILGDDTDAVVLTLGAGTITSVGPILVHGYRASTGGN